MFAIAASRFSSYHLIMEVGHKNEYLSAYNFATNTSILLFSRIISCYFLVTVRGPHIFAGGLIEGTTKLFSGNTVKTDCGSIAQVCHLE